MTSTGKQSSVLSCSPRHPLSWGAQPQAQAEELTLRKSDNMSGYANVSMPERTTIRSSPIRRW